MQKLHEQYSTKKTPQSEPIPGSGQVENSAGGHAWVVSKWTQLDRFLVLGTEGGTHYIGETKLTRENAKAVDACIQEDGLRAVARILEISKGGRAPKNDPALFALAMALKLGDVMTRKAAADALPEVARIGTHLFHLAQFIQAFGGWGRGTCRAFRNWYRGKSAESLAYQAIKYQGRDGWTHKDILRKAHAHPPTRSHSIVFRFMSGVEGGKLTDDFTRDEVGEESRVSVPLKGKSKRARFRIASDTTVPRAIQGFLKVSAAGAKVEDIVAAIKEFGVPREALPTQFLKKIPVWEALLEKMPMTAMIRNLGVMTSNGLIKPLSDASTVIADRLVDRDKLVEARVHPIQVLSALLTYKSGRGVRGKLTWDPSRPIIDALDEAFYRSFQSVEPTGKRVVLALDVSGSMATSEVAGVPGLTPRVGSAAMAMVTARTEKNWTALAFTNRGGYYQGWEHEWQKNCDLTPLNISPRQRLDDVVKAVSDLEFGGTDCSLPMRWALENDIKADAFVIYTDNETWHGKIHPAQALQEYRRRTGINAKLIVVAMVGNGFSIADPNDAGMLDVSGFDTATPALIADFIRS